jgi:nicotinate-nucleotide adenylyltransferase
MKQDKPKKQTKKKIALFGGSFNPIHNDHIKIMQELINEKIVDEVWIMPCKKHAFNKELVNGKKRVEMIKLAIEEIEGIKICHIELRSKEKSYTFNTLEKLRSKYYYEFLLMVGSDILYEIDKWHDYQKLLKETKFIVFGRKSYPIKPVEGLNIFHLIKEETKNISSTKIREKVKEHKSLEGLVPKPVENYIKKEHLYV